MLMRRGGEVIWCVLLSGLYVVLSAPPVCGQTVPQFGHVFIVLEENHGYSQVVGSSGMPYLTSLISKYGLATNYVADTHPSIDNYFMLTVGAFEANNIDSWNCTTTTGVVSDDNIVRELVKAGKTWKIYAESIPSTGYTGCDSGYYDKHHNPFAYLNDVANDSTQVNNMVDFTNNFASDLANGTLPAYSFIVPNSLHSSHSGTLAQADSWLQSNIDPLVQSTLFQTDGLLIVVFDEDQNTTNPGCTGSGNNCGGQVAAVIVSPKIISPGFTSANTYHHENLLRLMAEGIGLASFPGRAATSANMSEFFSAPGTPAVTLLPVALAFGNQQVSTTSTAQAATLANGTDSTVSISGIAITGANSGDFAQTTTCGPSLTPGASCAISVTFTPAASGARTATLAVTDSATGSPQTVSLAGTGVSSGWSGPDYYVSTVGSDSTGDGSALNPWATIAFASTKIGAGATVHVAPGTYSGQFNTNASGTSSAYITYISDTKWGAKIAGGSSSTWSNYGAYVAIENFDVAGPTGCCNAIYTSGNATQIIGNDVHNVQNSKCNSTGGGGVVVDSTNAQVIGNYAHDNGPSTACNYIQGIYIANSSNPGSGAYVANNISFHNSGWGIQLWHSATNETLVNNTIFNNLTGGIVVGASGATDDYTVVNNNIVYNNPGTNGGIVEEGTTGTHNTYTDNLVYGNTPVDVSLQNGLTAMGTVSANPLFVNYTGSTSGDYHLQSSSPAINAGTSQDAPTIDYDGNPQPGADGVWDIGAYEYLGPTSPSVTLSPAALTFTAQNVGLTSAVQSVTVSNTGNASLSITSVAVSGDFAQTNTCSGPVAPGANCAVNVTFTPTVTGTRTGAVTITDSAADSPQTVNLAGTGVTPVASLSPSSLTFGNQPVGTTSAASPVTLSNTGSGALAITSIAVSGDFGQTNTCGGSLAAGANCTINVTFTPTASGARSGTLTVTDNAASNPQTVLLAGPGVTGSPVVTLSPFSLAFANQLVGTASAAKGVTLSNTGGAALSIGSIVISGTNAGDFAQTNNCGTSLGTGANCAINVTFAPTASGARSGTLTIADNASGSPQTVTLTGTGAAPAVTFSPASLSFGTQKVGTTSAQKTVKLSNAGTAPLTITSIVVTGTNRSDFSQTNNCPGTINPGANCSIKVTFKPAATGSRTGAITVTDNASGSPQAVGLKGSGS